MSDINHVFLRTALELLLIIKIRAFWMKQLWKIILRILEWGASVPFVLVILAQKAYILLTQCILILKLVYRLLSYKAIISKNKSFVLFLDNLLLMLKLLLSLIPQFLLRITLSTIGYFLGHKLIKFPF